MALLGRRSTSPPGDRETTTQVPYSVLIVWPVGPALVLTMFGVALFKRYRTLPSALVALGFAAVLVSGIFNVGISYDVPQIHGSSPNQALAFVSVQLHGPAWILARLCGPFGMWTASLSLLWHIFSTRGAASPNDVGGSVNGECLRAAGAERNCAAAALIEHFWAAPQLHR
jgi:hypothetical protein